MHTIHISHLRAAPRCTSQVVRYIYAYIWYYRMYNSDSICYDNVSPRCAVRNTYVYRYMFTYVYKYIEFAQCKHILIYIRTYVYTYIDVAQWASVQYIHIQRSYITYTMYVNVYPNLRHIHPIYNIHMQCPCTISIYSIYDICKCLFESPSHMSHIHIRISK